MIKRLLAMLFALALLTAACGSGSTAADDTATDDTAADDAAADDAADDTAADDDAADDAAADDAAADDATADDAAADDTAMEDAGKICEVTDVGGIDDKGFNASAWAGAQRAEAELGYTAQFLESQSDTDYQVNIDSLLDEECALIVTVGFLLGDVTETSAAASPDTAFTIVDFAYEAPTDNLKGLTFQTDQAAFLAGYVAAGTTQTGKVGTFGGINIPPVTIFMDGFLKGVNYFNEQNGTSVEVLGWDGTDGQFTGNFDSLDDGRAFAQNLVDEGADIVMPVAGPVGLGSAALASELGTDKLKIIGVDSDQFVADTNNSGVYLTSVLKRIDNAVFDAAAAVKDGTFDNSVYSGNLENEGVGLADFHDLDGEVPADVKSALDGIRAGIIDGSITL